MLGADESTSRSIGPFRLVISLLVAVFVVASFGTTASGHGGGTIENALPTVESFSNDVGGTAQGDDVDVIKGTVKDRNGAADIQEILVNATGGSDPTSTHTVTDAERGTTAEPVAFDADGWKVWDPSPGDGILNFSFRFTYPNAAATYHWSVSVKDEGLYETNLNNSVPNVEVIVSATTTGGGGGGGGGSSSSDSDAPSGAAAQDSDGDGVSDEVEELFGTDPTDVDEYPQFDATDRLEVIRSDGVVVLRWTPVDEAGGYLVWRSTSPWDLIGNVSANQTAFVDPQAPEGAKYKLTFFVAPGEGAGYVDSATRVAGWDDQTWRTVSAAEAGGEPAGSALDATESDLEVNGALGLPSWVRATAVVFIAGLVGAGIVVQARPEFRVHAARGWATLTTKTKAAGGTTARGVRVGARWAKKSVRRAATAAREKAEAARRRLRRP